MGYTLLVHIKERKKMDIYCKHCGEPWDIYELHDMHDGNDDKLTFKQASKQFAAFGCGAFTTLSAPKICTHAMVDQDMADRAMINQDLSPYPDEWIY
tara:strand:- start:39 stop:329 length:291 start_codon:yes stop_codon:yes gene_type:complete